MWLALKLSLLAILSSFLPEVLASSQETRKLQVTRSLDFQPIRVKFIDIGLSFQTSLETEKFKSVVLPVASRVAAQALSVQRLLPSTFGPYSSCDGYEVPLMENFGDADFYVFVSTEDLDEQVRSVTCLNEDSGLERPIMGRLRVSNELASAPLSIQKSAILRETIKLLGFSESQSHKWKKQDGGLYDYNSEVVTSSTLRQNLRKFLKTPKVLELAKSSDTFDCDSALGIELEEYTGYGEIGWHWDRRILFNEVMNYVLDLDMYLSKFTLAALEDSGWYKPNYESAQELLVGSRKGCGFLEDPCFDENVNLFPDLWCSSETTAECDTFSLQKASCEIVQQNPISGPDPTTDGCPYRRSTMSPCRPSEDLTSPSIPFTFEVNSENSRCFKSTLIQGPNPISFEYVACYEVLECSSGLVVIKVADQVVECSNKGQNVHVEGFSGVLTCPDPAALCKDVPCPDFCNGNGKCVKGKCQCFEGYKGFDCAMFCPKNCEKCKDANSCSKCEKGYFVSGNECTKCTGLCVECESGKVCSRCTDGAYLEDGSCKACVGACKTCCNLNSCMECVSGYHLVDKYCCPNSCTSCDHSQCFGCKDGLLLKNGKCVECPRTCKNCKDSKCSVCTQGYYLDTCSSCKECHCNCIECCNLNKCTKCKDGFFLNSHNECVSCPAVCSKCEDGKCKTCKLGYHKYNGICCKNGCAQCTLDRCISATAGSFINEGDPILCPQGSDVCWSGGSINCSPGFQPYQNTCVKCTENCEKCTDKVCLKCDEPYFLTLDGLCVPCPSTCTGCLNSRCTGCKTIASSDGYGCCPIGCTSCNTKECWTCADNYWLSQDKKCLDCPSSCSVCKSGVCHDCNQGYYLSGTTCVKCISPCENCVSATSCLSCSSGYLLTDRSTCVDCPQGCNNCLNSKCPDCVLAVNYERCCPIGCSSCDLNVCWTCFDDFWLTPGKQCVPCPSSCTKCQRGVCLDCNPGFYIVDTECQQCVRPCKECLAAGFCKSCIEGYLLASNGACMKCPDGCDGCPGSKCTSCALSEDFSRCCPSGCLSCDKDRCWTCKGNFYLYDGNCIDCPAGCSSCKDGVCLGCADGYFMSSTTCIQCRAPCRTCYSETKCLSCEEGQLLSDTETCVACPTACGNCSGNKCCIMAVDNSGCCPTGCLNCNSQVCLNCFAGYYQTGSGTCDICPDLCTECADDVCKGCVSGYYLKGKECDRCIDNCDVCYNKNSCSKCLDNFYLDSNQCVDCPSTCLICSDGICKSCKPGFDYSGTTCA